MRLRHSIIAPGNNGFITEETIEATGNAAWARAAEGAEIDEGGRLGARKGYTALSTSVASLLRIHEFIVDKDTSHILSSDATDIYDGTTSPVAGVYGTTPTAGYWRFLNYNGSCVVFQAGETPQYWDGTTRSGPNASWLDLGASNPPSFGNSALSAWGRIWVSDSTETTISFSQLLMNLASGDWTAAGGGALSTVEIWPDGLDRITALAELENRLLIFGTRSILVYKEPIDPIAATFQLEDIIHSGTYFRDSVVNVGGDVLYLAPDGLRSVRRGLESDRLPLTDISTQIKRNLTKQMVLVEQETGPRDKRDVVAAHDPVDGLYVVRIGPTITGSPAPLFSKGGWYAFDTKRPTTGGNSRTSRWGAGADGLKAAAWSSVEQKLYLIDSTEGVSERDDSNADDGSTFTFDWVSSWLDIGEPGRLIQPKSLVLDIATAINYEVTVKWGFDYDSHGNFETVVSLIDPAQAELASIGGPVNRLQVELTGSGDVISIGVEVDIDGVGSGTTGEDGSFALERVSLLYTHGRFAA